MFRRLQHFEEKFTKVEGGYHYRPWPAAKLYFVDEADKVALRKAWKLAEQWYGLLFIIAATFIGAAFLVFIAIVFENVPEQVLEHGATVVVVGPLLVFILAALYPFWIIRRLEVVAGRLEAKDFEVENAKELSWPMLIWMTWIMFLLAGVFLFVGATGHWIAGLIGILCVFGCYGLLKIMRTKWRARDK